MKRKIALLSVLWVLIGAVWILGLNWPRFIGAKENAIPETRASGEGTGTVYALNEAEPAEEAADPPVPETAAAGEQRAEPSAGPSAAQAGEEPPAEDPDMPEDGAGEAVVYVLNTHTKKIHLPDCPSVADIKEKNRGECGDPEEALAEGYEWCKRCHG